MRKWIVNFLLCGTALVAEAAPRKLSWAPPMLTNPVTKSIGPTRSSLKLDVTKDYILKLPENEPYIGELNIYGGHNVVIIGGEVKIPTEEEGYTNSKRGVYLHGQTGTIHVEGLHITGAGLHEGFNLDERHPDCIVQLQNIRVEYLHGSYSGNHADVIQSWAGPNILRIDGLTGYTQYQGFFLLPNQHFSLADGGFVPALYDFRHLNIVGDETASAYMLWTQDKATQPPTKLTDVWVRPRTSNLGNRNQYLWPKNDTVWNDVNEGLPPGGDFVPASLVGIGYVSPGYAEDIPDETGVRYVSPAGSDEYHGRTADRPLATLGEALAQLAELGQGVVRLAPGEYVASNAVETTTWNDHNDVTATNTCYVLSNAIAVVGTTGNPADVVIRRVAKVDGVDFYARLFLLNHPDARLEALTVSEGKPATGNGGNVYIGTAGGTIENCILEKGDTTKNWGSCGGNLFLRAGRANRCVIRSGKAKEGSGQWFYGGGVAMYGGVLANSLIAGNTCAKGASVWMKSSAKMVNCTIAGNTGKNISGVHAESNCTVINCAIFGNVSSGDTTGTKHVWDKAPEVFDHCAAEIAINENCIAVDDPAFVGAVQGDYALTRTSPLVNAGVAEEAAGATDLVGKRRRSGAVMDIGCDEYLWSGLSLVVQ